MKQSNKSANWKRRLILAALVAMATVGIQSQSLAGVDQIATVKSHISVNDNVITLGDVFLDAGAADNVVVAAAPAPGQRSRLSPRHVQQIAAINGLAWRNPARLEWLTVERNSQIVAQQTILEELSHQLDSAGMKGEHDILLSDRQLVLHVPINAVPDIETVSFNVDSQNGFFEAQLRVPAGDNTAPTVLVTGRAYPAVEVPTLNIAKQRGDIIEPGDIDWTLVRVDRLSRDAIVDAEDLVGMALRRRATPGQSLREDDIETPVVVKKGSLVLIYYQTGAMNLTLEGRALKSGGIGETIQVVNTRSNQTIYGRVEGPARVSATPLAFQVSTNP